MRYLLSWTAWPALFTICMLITGYGFVTDQPVLFFNLAYLFLAVSLYIFERMMPHEAVWNEDDGQTFANIAHTLLSKGTVQTLVVFSTAIGLATLVTPAAEAGHGIWPRDWPMPVQVVMGVVLAEFGLYWAHRLAHEWLPLWHFHAVHHSVTRLWIINTGRFHFIDSIFSILLSMTILVSLGAPMEVLVWLSAITAFIGMLTHCNVEMHFGPISWVFNTPGLHRWHHSRDISEGNKNYGENLMLWDQLFGTYFNPPRRPPVNIGINEYMPPRFGQQLAHPFRQLLKGKPHKNGPEAAE
ncbi:MAG: sterol desaturase family protein [Rhodospirillales bacterium]|nr:sterol desaturase family protein [Rhodospirillales bacterium]MCB9994920.1 sterol desaturase family protein [Rhodospirillales bacterium]